MMDYVNLKETSITGYLNLNNELHASIMDYMLVGDWHRRLLEAPPPPPKTF